MEARGLSEPRLHQDLHTILCLPSIRSLPDRFFSGTEAANRFHFSSHPSQAPFSQDTFSGYQVDRHDVSIDNCQYQRRLFTLRSPLIPAREAGPFGGYSSRICCWSPRYTVCATHGLFS